MNINEEEDKDGYYYIKVVYTLCTPTEFDVLFPLKRIANYSILSKKRKKTNLSLTVSNCFISRISSIF